MEINLIVEAEAHDLAQHGRADVLAILLRQAVELAVGVQDGRDLVYQFNQLKVHQHRNIFFIEAH